MARTQTKKNEKLSTGGIIALVIAGLLLVAMLVGIIFYVHSGKAGVDQSAGLITAGETTFVEQKTKAETGKAKTAAAETKTVTDKDGNVAVVEEKDGTTKVVKAVKSEESAAKETAEKLSAKDIVFANSVTAKQLGQYYDADVDTFRKLYDGKRVTVRGKISGKSAKMLYVELATGTKVPLRVYLSTEEQREAFNLMPEGKTISVKGNVAVLYPQQMDNGGFQEMANGLIALDNVSLVK